MKIPRLLIAGTASGVGKTTVTMGIGQALIKRGLVVQSFKVGPDYIDPGFHTEVTGRLCRNLDSWLVPEKKLPDLFARAADGADCAIVEGVMGLFDAPHMAALLGLPVILVIDGSAISGSAAALVQGFDRFDKKLRIAGCLVNRVSGRSHYELIKGAIDRYVKVPVLGFLPREEGLALPQRHLGLVPSAEGRHWRSVLPRLLETVRQTVDLDAVLRIARRAPPFSYPESPPEAGPPSAEKAQKVPIGLAMDEAFHFYYPENVELLRELGAEIVPFSPLADRAFPAGIRALYLGGGFPEVYAAALGKNRSLHRQIACAHAAGMPIYAECGGLMFLARSITDTRGRRYPMAGLIPGDVEMTSRLQNFGYKRVKARRSTYLARVGETARGHEFHHSVLKGVGFPGSAPYEVASVSGSGRRAEGFVRGRLVASYVHLNFLSQPRWASFFVRAAQHWKGNG